MSNEKRMVEMEIKLAYQEDLLQTLNVIVTKQQQQIGKLEATLLVLYERLKSLSIATELNQDDNQPPPHY
jgi:SlyX protein